MKIRPVGAELLHADGWIDGRTDITKLILVLRNLANAPKTYIKCHKINANVSVSLLFRHVPFKIAVKDGSNEI